MAAQLNSVQLNALFEILTHAECFSEVRDARNENYIANFGPPMTAAIRGVPPAFPVVQFIISKFVGQGLYSDAGWADQCAMIQRLCAVNLSDSYDKGFFGLRKNFATGLASGLESVARGVLAGAPRDPKVNLEQLATKKYDIKDAGQLIQAWDDAVQGFLYGDLADRVFRTLEKTADLDALPPVATAALEYVMICAATLMHYLLVVTPEGQNLVKMMDTIDTLTPYSIIKSTVRVGNVQSMLNGIMKILLAKVGDKNLIQTMVSRVLKLDLHDLEKRVEKMQKKSKDGKGLPKEVAAALEDYVHLPRSTQESIRLRSQSENKSIITSILEAHYPSVPPPAVQDISPEQHDLAIEYLGIQLSIRDRRMGVQVICKDKPDLLSPCVKEQVALITPLLSILHDGKFDIGQAITLLKSWMEDFLKTAKVTSKHTPTVADFHALLQRHLVPFWKLLHDGSVKCPSLHAAVEAWCHEAYVHFRLPGEKDGESRTGAMTGALQAMYGDLPAAEKQAVAAAIDEHAGYTVAVNATNRMLLQEVLDKRCSPAQVGPSPMLPRWHALLDAQLLTPATSLGQVRTGRSTGLAEKKEGMIEAPNSSVVVSALGKAFRAHVEAERISAFSMGDMASNLPRAGLPAGVKFNIQTSGASIPA